MGRAARSTRNGACRGPVPLWWEANPVCPRRIGAPRFAFSLTHERCRRRGAALSPPGGVDCVTRQGLTVQLHTPEAGNPCSVRGCSHALRRAVASYPTAPGLRSNGTRMRGLEPPRGSRVAWRLVDP
jgi:hypothetical protein